MFFRFATRCSNTIDLINGLIGQCVSWLTLVMVVVTCIVVLVRYMLNMGSIGLQESVMYMHGTVFMLGIAYTLMEKGHVRVDVLYERFSPRIRSMIDLIGTVVFLFPVSIFIFWSGLDYVSFAWTLKEGSGQPGGLPGVYLIKTLIPILGVLLFVQGISELLKSSIALMADR